MRGILKKMAGDWCVIGQDFIYSLSEDSVYYEGFALKEGKEINFETEITIVDDVRFTKAVITPSVTRIEIIDKTKGREYTLRGDDIEISFQDGGKTLKIFK